MRARITLGALMLGLAAAGPVVIAPAASAGPYCDLDVLGVCDVGDALKACNAAPEACQQYTPPPATRYTRPSG